MDQSPPPHQPDPILHLAQDICRHLIDSLCAVLPPPLSDTPQALAIRNQAAIAQLAALAPANVAEAEVAVQCIATGALAEDILRLIQLHDGDIRLVMKLNAQHMAMERTALAAHKLLLRIQRVRQQREQSSAAREQDERTRNFVYEQMTWAMRLAQSAPVAAQPQPDSAPAPAVAPPQAPPSPRRPTLKLVENGQPSVDETDAAGRYVMTYPHRIH